MHGIPDTSKLGWLENSSVTGSEVNGSVLTKVAGMWVGAVPAADSDYKQTFSFATPTTVWVIDHNQGTDALSVELFDAGGRRAIAEVLHPTPNRIEVHWFYPSTGSAVVHE